MSRFLTRPAIFVIVPLLLPAAAQAQGRRVADPADAGTVEAPVTEIEFREVESVEGTRHGPGGEVVTGQARTPRSSLIVVRPSFRPELLRSADAL